MKHLIKFESYGLKLKLEEENKIISKYQSTKDNNYYKDVCDSLFYEIDDYFKDKSRFFPLKVKLGKARSKNNESYYHGSICMGTGWYERMDDKEQSWIESRIESYKDRYKIKFDMCGDSHSNMYFYEIENSSWPKSTQDMLGWPTNPFPGRG